MVLFLFVIIVNLDEQARRQFNGQWWIIACVGGWRAGVPISSARGRRFSSPASRGDGCGREYGDDRDAFLIPPAV
jgi:hypothetical protein